MKRISLLSVFIFTSLLLFSQQKKEVLFIGNSYTAFNNLPALVSSLAVSVGDTLVFDSHTPGGNRLQDHAINATALSKIAAKNWDFVVLQGQSQEPAFPISQVQDEVFPFATILCDTIRSGSECSVPLFYMTWGRENGDASNCGFYPPICTYEGMDSLLQARYLIMAEENEAKVSPIAKVWRYIRENNPNIQLYNADGSHPSPIGSYAAACCFYTTIFEKDPNLLTYNFTIDSLDAAIIRNAVNLLVFNDLESFDFTKLVPTADFEVTVLNDEGNEIEIVNNSINASSYLWNFGDGNTSSLENPGTHIYLIADSNTVYDLTLIAEKCKLSDTLITMINVDAIVDITSVQNQNANSFYDGRNIGCACGGNSFGEYFTEINLFNTNGQLVYTLENVGTNATIPTSELENQVYFIEMITNKKKYLNKVVVY